MLETGRAVMPENQCKVYVTTESGSFEAIPWISLCGSRSELLCFRVCKDLGLVPFSCSHDIYQDAGGPWNTRYIGQDRMCRVDSGGPKATSAGWFPVRVVSFNSTILAKIVRSSI